MMFRMMKRKMRRKRKKAMTSKEETQYVAFAVANTEQTSSGLDATFVKNGKIPSH